MPALVQGGVSTWKWIGSATIKPPTQQHSRPNASGEHRNHTSGPSPSSRLPPPSALFPHRQRPAPAASSFRGLSTWTATPRRLASRRGPHRKTFRAAVIRYSVFEWPFRGQAGRPQLGGLEEKAVVRRRRKRDHSALGSAPQFRTSVRCGLSTVRALVGGCAK